MKIQLLARPDHSLFLYEYLKSRVNIQMLNFNVAKKNSLLHRLHPASKIVGDEVKILYDFIAFNQIIFRLGLKNPYKWEGRYANFSYGWSARSYQPDIIHYWPLYCHNYVKGRRAKSGVKTVADVYCAHPEAILEKLGPEYDRYGMDIRNSYFYKDAERSTSFLEHEQHIITNSDYVKDSFLRYAPGKTIHVADYGFLGNPYALRQYEEALAYQQEHRGPDLRLVYVGTVSVEKGVHYLLEAVKKLNSPSIQLDLIGPMTEAQKTVFEPYRNSKVIRFLGFLPNAALKEKLKSYSALVLPSLSDANSIAVIEGLQSALPVIVTDATGNRDAVQRYGTGQVVPAADSDRLAQAIERLLPPDFRAEQAHNIRNYILEDAVYPYPEKVFHIYRSLLSGEPVTRTQVP